MGNIWDFCWASSVTDAYSFPMGLNEERLAPADSTSILKWREVPAAGWSEHCGVWSRKQQKGLHTEWPLWGSLVWNLSTSKHFRGINTFSFLFFQPHWVEVFDSLQLLHLNKYNTYFFPHYGSTKPAEITGLASSRYSVPRFNGTMLLLMEPNFLKVHLNCTTRI